MRCAKVTSRGPDQRKEQRASLRRKLIKNDDRYTTKSQKLFKNRLMVLMIKSILSSSGVKVQEQRVPVLHYVLIDLYQYEKRN